MADTHDHTKEKTPEANKDAGAIKKTARRNYRKSSKRGKTGDRKSSSDLKFGSIRIGVTGEKGTKTFQANPKIEDTELRELVCEILKPDPTPGDVTYARLWSVPPSKVWREAPKNQGDPPERDREWRRNIMPKLAQYPKVQVSVYVHKTVKDTTADKIPGWKEKAELSPAALIALGFGMDNFPDLFA